jgi:hypothetical protein
MAKKDKMFLYRVPAEIDRHLNRMEAPSPKFRTVDFQVQMSTSQVDMLLEDAFRAGYRQAVKEMKKFFGV